jgi:glycerol-3-phosphate dehydrogenase
VEDVLCRRTRALFLNAKAALEAAPKVASLMAHELEYDADWELTQRADFERVALHFQVGKAPADTG